MVTKEQFEAFEEVRGSGVTNMWDTPKVCSLSKGVLTDATVLAIIKDYRTWRKLYNG
jgi:hypothetical protein